ncbi:hypothetical protein [Agarivorans sp. DSG3-1]|uniref:hypothetical protein n=1 Tax=Agarivorans sp. DSG3-1 TaxID=3342249 RepID=UPI00398EAD5D
MVGVKGQSSGFGLPTIGNHVCLSAGAIVLGSVQIGENTTIGAGAVVVKDVPANSVAVGNPARCFDKPVEHQIVGDE